MFGFAVTLDAIGMSASCVCAWAASASGPSAMPMLSSAASVRRVKGLNVFGLFMAAFPVRRRSVQHRLRVTCRVGARKIDADGDAIERNGRERRSLELHGRLGR